MNPTGYAQIVEELAPDGGGGWQVARTNTIGLDVISTSAASGGTCTDCVSRQAESASIQRVLTPDFTPQRRQSGCPVGPTTGVVDLPLPSDTDSAERRDDPGTHVGR